MFFLLAFPLVTCNVLHAILTSMPPSKKRNVNNESLQTVRDQVFQVVLQFLFMLAQGLEFLFVVCFVGGLFSQEQWKKTSLDC